MLLRRNLFGLAAAAASHRSGSRYKAVALDAFTVFDPRPLAARAEEVFPGKGPALFALWQRRQFEYTWLRTLTNSYVDFRQVTETSLLYALKASSLEASQENRERLLSPYHHLTAWPDAHDALLRMKNAGLRLVFLSNFTGQMMTAGTASCGLQSLLDGYLSTDRVRAFKPDPRAYRMAVHRLKLPVREIVFAAFAGWDAAGAKAFGYPTFWVNRMSLPVEELGFQPDAAGSGLDDLARFIITNNSVTGAANHPTAGSGAVTENVLPESFNARDGLLKNRYDPS